MPYRWVISPIVWVTNEEGQPYRVPKAATIIDPGRGKVYMHSSCADIKDWALSLVLGTDLSALLADPQVVDLFGQDGGPELLDRTPGDLGFKAGQVNTLKNKLAARGVDTTGLTITTPIEIWLDRLATAVAPCFRARGTRVG